MKKLFLLGLMMLASSAWAEWGKYASSDGVEFFFDPSTVRKSGNFSKVWVIYNLPSTKDGASSYRLRKEFDCSNEKFRALYFSMHTKKFAKGEVLESSDEPDSHWSEIPPRSPVRILHAIVCAK
jgi:hypothetical protein